MISSLNHHISILRLRVHPRCIEFLTTGEGDLSTEWYGLQLDRSRWFDLFKPDDRLQAMRGVWAVMGFLMRDVEKEDRRGSGAGVGAVRRDEEA